MCVYVCECVCVGMHTYIHKHIHSHTLSHTHTHTYTHTYTHKERKKKRKKKGGEPLRGRLIGVYLGHAPTMAASTGPWLCMPAHRSECGTHSIVREHILYKQKGERVRGYAWLPSF